MVTTSVVMLIIGYLPDIPLYTCTKHSYYDVIDDLLLQIDKYCFMKSACIDWDIEYDIKKNSKYHRHGKRNKNKNAFTNKK